MEEHSCFVAEKGSFLSCEGHSPQVEMQDEMKVLHLWRIASHNKQVKMAINKWMSRVRTGELLESWRGATVLQFKSL